MKKLLYLLPAAILLLTGCKGSEPDNKAGETAEENRSAVTLTAESIKETGIESSEAKIEPISGFISLPARMTTNQDNEAVVGSLVKGRVKKVFVNLGISVVKGEELMELEGLEIGEIKSAYRKAKANLDYTESSYKRIKSLNEQNVSSTKSLIESKAEYDKALAEFKAEDEKIHSIGLTDDEALNSTANHSSGVFTVRAPINGIITERNVIIGQLVDENSSAFKIINTSELIADAQIYEKDTPLIKGDPSVNFTTPVYTGVNFPGRINYISPVVDEKTRTINIRAAISNNSGKLKPQMFGELNIPVNTNASAVVIPTSALINDNGKYFIFVRTGDTSFEKRDVETGITNKERTEIRTGLKEGEKVVIKGTFYLKSEMLKSSFGEEE